MRSSSSELVDQLTRERPIHWHIVQLAELLGGACVCVLALGRRRLYIGRTSEQLNSLNPSPLPYLCNYM